MLQAILVKPERFVLEEVEVPRPARDEVLVRVLYCGICGSDVHTYRGGNSFVRYPALLGHELAGEVVTTGPGVAGFTPGQRVTFEPTNECGECVRCRAGEYNLCLKRTPTQGAFREYVPLRADRTYAVSNRVDARHIVLVEPLASALHALDTAAFRSGESVLVYGAGTIGQLVAEAARLRGAEYVAVVNRSVPKLEIARRNGADEVIHVPEGLPCERAIERIGRDRFDVAFDTVATEDSFGCSLKSLRSGGRLVVVGTPSGQIPLDVVNVMLRELKVLGCLKYRNNFPEALRMIEHGRIHADAYLSRTVALEDVESAFREILTDGSRLVKCLISPGG